jgi:release factor glutamine methyltransferase
MDFDRELDEPVLARLRELVKRRAAGEPLQYITGEAEFCGLMLAVDRRVLIPRPETELLVDTALSRIVDHYSPKTIVDVCTGSGCVAIALANNLPGANIFALDISPDALEVARANAKRHNFEKKIRFLESDLLQTLPDSSQADAVVSNPPYIALGDVAKLPKEVRDFEPVRALAAGEDGFEVFRRLVMDARRVLSPSGFVACEMGAGQRAGVENLFVNAGWRVMDVVQDLQGHERVIVAGL